MANAPKLSPDMPVVKSQSAQPSTHSKALAKRLTDTHAHNGHGGNKLSLAAAKALLAKHRGAQFVAPGLTYGQLKRDTNAATGLRYGAASQALRGQVVQNEAQGARTAEWFTQYQNAIAAAANQQKAQSDAAVAGVGQIQQNLNDSSKQAWAGQQAAMTADAAQRGATADRGLADQAHNASNVRNALTGSYGAMLASQGAAQQQGLGDRKVTAGQQGLEALRLNASQRADLAKQRTAFEKEKGQFKVQFQQQEKSNAGDSALKAALTQSQIGTAQANAVQSYASANASNANAGKTKTITAFVQKYGYVPSSQPSKLEQAKLDYFNKHGYFPPTGPPKPKGAGSGKDAFGNTKAQREASNNDWGRAKTVAGLIGGNDIGTIATDITVKYPTIPPWMARAAAQQFVLGHVGGNMAHRLRQHGVKHGYNRSSPKPNDAGHTDASGGY